MWSYRCLAPLAALLALMFACVQGAPPGARDLRDYGAGRNLALQLNEGARYLYREVKVYTIRVSIYLCLTLELSITFIYT